MTPFREIVPYDRFRDLVASLAGPGNDAYHAALRDIAEPALRRLLEERREAGLLRPVPNSRGHETNFLVSWNAVSGGGSRSAVEADWRRVLDFLAHSTIGWWAIVAEGPKEGVDPETVARDAYGKLADVMDSGNVSHFNLESQHCFSTGERYRVRFEGWNPEFLARGADGKLAPMVPGPELAVREFEVTFETGELLVADWFRIPAFNAAVDGRRRKGKGPDSVEGREDAAVRYTALGFVSVSVGNSCPTVFERDGVLVFGRGEEEGLGQVVTDVWCVTAIDRARLVALVAGKVGEAKAEAEVAAYLAENDVLRLKVEPGRHFLYMSGEYDRFDELFAPGGIELDGIEPRLALSNRRLDLEAAPAGPRP